VLLLLVALLGTGCVYYNGMYNTKRFAHRARNAEKDGRTFEAQGSWGQVSVRAESLLARHPRSKYAEEARLLYGVARQRLNDCNGAIPSLEAVMLSSRRSEFAEEAAELLATCRVKLGDPASAATVFARLTASTTPRRRDLALFAHGQALRLNREYDAAYDELKLSQHPQAQGERAAALAGAGRLEEAGLVIDSLVAAGDTLAPWSEILAAIGREDVEAASQLTNRLVDQQGTPVQLRGRLLIDDGLRLSEVDPARGNEQLLRVTQLPGPDRGVEARLILAQRRLAGAESLDSLRAIAMTLDELPDESGSFTPAVTRMRELTARAVLAADSVAPGAPQGDLRLFLAAELGRDSIGAPRFARQQFERIVSEWPASPFAPKALLALVSLSPDQSDALQQKMRNEYATSPYLLLVDGGDSPQLVALEDSLGRYVLGFRGPQLPGVNPSRPGAQPNRPSRTMEPQ
jgi:hypothetical protein